MTVERRLLAVPDIADSHGKVRRKSLVTPTPEIDDEGWRVRWNELPGRWPAVVQTCLIHGKMMATHASFLRARFPSTKLTEARDRRWTTVHADW
jgi:hypothetical protein